MLKLSEMREILSASGIQLTKSLGQNFLHDANQLQRIIAAAQLSQEDRVLEIGPGLGPLTEILAENAMEILAIEKDHRLFTLLQQRFAEKANVRLIEDDALDFLRREPIDWSEWKMVSNLPYSVASPLLVELALTLHPPKLIVVTLQLEVVRRLAARAGEKDYGVLTLLVQLSYKPQDWFKIPAGCFFPEPEVDSACISLERRPALQLSAEERRTFVRVVKRSFSQRRKMMKKLLKAEWPEELLQEAFRETGLDLGIRAEAVELAQFIRLTQFLQKNAVNKA